jgi:hypothetical protein
VTRGGPFPVVMNARVATFERDRRRAAANQDFFDGGTIAWPLLALDCLYTDMEPFGFSPFGFLDSLLLLCCPFAIASSLWRFMWRPVRDGAAVADRPPQYSRTKLADRVRDHAHETQWRAY